MDPELEGPKKSSEIEARTPPVRFLYTGMESWPSG